MDHQVPVELTPDLRRTRRLQARNPVVVPRQRLFWPRNLQHQEYTGAGFTSPLTKGLQWLIEYQNSFTSIGNNQPEVFLHKVLRPPRVMNVRAFGSRTSAEKTLFSCAPAMG